MTNKQYAKAREPARKEADLIVSLKRPEDVDIPNIMGEVAKAMLRNWGWYACRRSRKGGAVEKVFYEVIA